MAFINLAPSMAFAMPLNAHNFCFLTISSEIVRPVVNYGAANLGIWKDFGVNP